MSKEQNAKKRKAIRASFIRKLTIEETEVIEVPSQVAQQYLHENQMLKEKISELEENLEEKAEEVFNLLQEAVDQRNKTKVLEEATDGLKNQGKPIHEVGDRQRYRQLNNFR